MRHDKQMALSCRYGFCGVIRGMTKTIAPGTALLQIWFLRRGTNQTFSPRSCMLTTTGYAIDHENRTPPHPNHVAADQPLLRTNYFLEFVKSAKDPGQQ
jgi:hypothetical protein